MRWSRRREFCCLKINVGKMAQDVGSTRFFPYMDGCMIRAYFGRRRQIESAEILEESLEVGCIAKLGWKATWRVSWTTGIIRGPRSRGERC